MSARHLIPAMALGMSLLVLAGCTPDDSGTAESAGSDATAGPQPSTGQDARDTAAAFGDAAAEVVAEDLEAPWSIVFFRDAPIVSERDSARILELAADGSTREIGVVDEAAPMGEGGLLGLAVHEDHLYAYYTAESENRIDRYPLQGEPGSLSLGEADPILSGIPSASFHNGGRIAVGPDGMLYATAGDAGAQDSAQDREELSGKILRMTPTGGVPADNPFEDSLVYSYGHRNPQGIAWGEDGTLYASEFGQDTWDELNVIEAGGNYGWPEVEGVAEQSGYIDPVQQWETDVASPSGIAIAAGSVFIANLRGERLREVPLDELGTSSEHHVGEFGRLRDVVVAPDGSLWVLTNNTDGRGEPGPEDDRILRFAPQE